jgi:hypothetical protein
MTAAPVPKRILSGAVVVPRSTTCAALERASARQWIKGMQVARIGDVLIDPIDGEVRNTDSVAHRMPIARSSV